MKIKLKDNTEFTVTESSIATAIVVNFNDAASIEAFRQKLTDDNLTEFKFMDVKFPLNPKSLYYDYLYILALFQNSSIANEVLRYDCFTDIEFNPQKSLNCQARSVAIFVSLYKKGLLEQYLDNKELFKTIYSNKIQEQLKLF